MSNFNPFGQLQTELTNFFSTHLQLAKAQNQDNVRNLAGSDDSYSFNQWDVLNTVEMYYNSQFLKGKRDAEGQRKIFMNIVSFRSDVASKQVDIDTKNFVFVPEDANSVWGAFFLNKRFKQWAKEEFFGEVINQVVEDYPKYGTAVLKRVGDTIEKVPIKTIRIQQDAKSIKEATYFIQEHKDMPVYKIKEMKEWDTDNLDMPFGSTLTVYERYGRVPLSFYKSFRGDPVTEADHGETIDTMMVMTLEAPLEKDDEWGGTMLFMEKISVRPFEEVHWRQQDGRWLGVGEVENLFENQITQNMVQNLRRRALMWSSKKIFQTQDLSSEVAANLIRNVKDGDVMKVGPGGEISQVNMSTQALPDFNAAQQTWENNSNQKSFTFEVATGEALPSGTPFRLGVLLSNAANSHFGLKREKLGLFFKRVVADQLFPIFKAQNRSEHTITLFADEEGIGSLKRVLIDVHVAKELKKVMLDGNLPNVDLVKGEIEAEIDSRPQLFMKIPAKYYDELKVKTDLVITGESVDLPKKIETLTNVYNILAQKQDPRADAVLERIVGLTGENIETTAAPADVTQAAQQPAGAQIQQAFAQPQSQELNPQATL